MKKIKLLIELEYDDCMHSDNQEEIDWFEQFVLLGDNEDEDGGLILHSNYIGDELGTVKVLKIRPEKE